MTSTYHQFLKRGIDLAPLGVERRTSNETYFCTPKGASMIGWAGVDGIHYCFIRGFGEMVFAVSPMNAAPDYVHPIAKNFTDFLRLLLACADASALEQAWMWDKDTFEDFLEKNPATAEQEKTCAKLSETMKLTAMEQPWVYIKTLQASFDYSKIRYTEDFYDPEMNVEAERKAPEWKVFFDGNFWGHHGKDRAGKEISIAKRFEWVGRQWWVPAIYICGKGMVIDFCMRVETEEIHAFMKKWNIDQEKEPDESFTWEQRRQMEMDNPFCLHFEPRLEMNGKSLSVSQGCSVCYHPCPADGMTSGLEAKWVVDHYDLDAACGWVISRNAFSWGSGRRPEIKKLLLTMTQQAGPVLGLRFRVKAPGDTVSFSHPTSGVVYTLTVKKIERGILPRDMLDPQWEYPTHYCAMYYTVHPENPDDKLTVEDCVKGDRPREKQKTASPYPYAPTATDDVAVIGIIGGADGPTALILEGGEEKTRIACSSLHFSPVDDVEWRAVFHEKQFDDTTVELIGYR